MATDQRAASHRVRPPRIDRPRVGGARSSDASAHGRAIAASADGTPGAAPGRRPLTDDKIEEIGRTLMALDESMASGPPHAPCPNAEHTDRGVPELRRSRIHQAGNFLPAKPPTEPAGCMSSLPDHPDATPIAGLASSQRLAGRPGTRPPLIVTPLPGY